MASEPNRRVDGIDAGTGRSPRRIVHAAGDHPRPPTPVQVPGERDTPDGVDEREVIRPRTGRWDHLQRHVAHLDHVVLADLDEGVGQPSPRTRAGEHGDFQAFGESLGARVVVRVGVRQRDRAEPAAPFADDLQAALERRPGGITGVNQHDPPMAHEVRADRLPGDAAACGHDDTNDIGGGLLDDDVAERARRKANEVGDVCAHVEKETDKGLIISGAKVVATGSVLTNYTFVAHHGLIPVQDKKFAVVFMVPTNTPGVKFICRTSYEMQATVMGSPFDYPLSSRVDENDAVFIMDKVLVPWENVFVYGDVEKANNFFPRTGFLPRFVVHGCTRLAVKLDFIAGLLLKAVEAAGTKDYRGVQANVGEVIAWRNLFWALSDAMVRDPRPWIGDYLLPNMDPGNAYAIIATMAYTKIKYIIEQTVASGLIYLNSHAGDFKNPEIRPYLDRYLRGSNGYKAEERVKLMKLLWDCLGSEFGGRHELYEINYGGSTEEIRRYCLFGAQASGNADRFKGFAEQCMAEYDLDGWRVPDLTDPGELSYHAMRGAG